MSFVLLKNLLVSGPSVTILVPGVVLVSVVVLVRVTFLVLVLALPLVPISVLILVLILSLRVLIRNLERVPIYRLT